MRIAIDVSPLKSPHRFRGTGVYVENLVAALEKSGSGHRFFYVSEKDKLPEKIDVLHIPFFDPFHLTLPFIRNAKLVITIHDLIPFVFPEHFRSGFQGKIKWQIQKLLTRRASRIITDSFCSKKDISRIMGIRADIIDVIYLAPNAVKPCHDNKYQHMTFNYEDRYFVYTGDINWNKNIPGLLRAFAIFLEQNKSVKLVLVGKAFVENSSVEIYEIRDIIRSLNITDSVIMTGYINNSDLATIYKNALALVQPSFYEGFGLPVLEAMPAGCPVIAADNSSLKEIMGPAIPIDAGSTESIVGALNSVIQLNNKERQELINKGKLWSSKFTWPKVAADTIKSYENT